MGNNLHFDLSHFSIIQVSGDDAEEFLENQLITHLPDLESAGWLLSAWCLPNGRILSNFILFENNHHYFLILPSMLKQKIIDRLKLYILRSNVSIDDASDDYALIGLAGEVSNDLLKQIYDGFTPVKKQAVNQSMILQMPDDTARWILLVHMDEVNQLMQQILLAFQESDRATWSLLDIKAGIPWVTTATSEEFIPQMLNLDTTGGLSYKKGCYPGQEIIARIHFRGEIKKRLYIGTGTSDVTPGPGDKLESIDDAKLIGDVIDAEPNPAGGFSFIATANIDENETIKACLRGEHQSLVELKPV